MRLLMIRNASVPSCADGMSNPSEPPKSAGVFDDLTVFEITSVRDYLLMQTELSLTRYEEATVNSNYIYLVKLLSPSKNEALAYLDGDDPKPKRKAIAIVFHGATFPPIVREYVISPVTNPNNHKIRNIPGKLRDFVPFNARPFDGSIEGNVLNEAIINNVSQALLKLMRESYDGYTYTNCTDKCLSFLSLHQWVLPVKIDTRGFFSFARLQANTVIP